MEKQTLSLVLPCFNEEANIERTIRDTNAWFDRTGTTGEIIVVNDGSSDDSQKILESLRPEVPRLKIVRHEKNRGYGLALRSGLDVATMDIVGFMDSDGQFRPEDLELLLPHLEAYAFVTGRRRRRADSAVRNAFGKVLGLMNWVALGLWVRDVNCGMKLFRREIWQRVRPTHGVEKLFNTELFLRLKEEGVVWKTIDVPHYPRTAGSPTGAKPSVIIRMFSELGDLRKSRRQRRRARRAAKGGA